MLPSAYVRQAAAPKEPIGRERDPGSEMDGEVPEAAEGEEAELPPRKWVGVPVK